MKRYNFIFLLLVILLFPNLSIGANHYIRAGASGNLSGTDWINAYNDLPSTLVRGDTYYVAAGTYSGYNFDDDESGSSYIYIKKATISDHGTSIGWNNFYGEGEAIFNGGITFGSSFWEIDGSVGSGQSGHGIRIQSNGSQKVVAMSNQSHIHIRHCNLDHQGNVSQSGLDIIYANSVRVSSTDIQISYCYLHDCGRCPILLTHTNNSIIEYCYISRNKLYQSDHSEGYSANFGGTDQGHNVVRFNIWKDIGGTGQIMITGDYWDIYGNLFYWTGTGYPNNTDCVVGNWSGKDQAVFGSSFVKVYNNTIVDISGGGTIDCEIYFYPGEQGNEAFNNLWVNCRSARITNANIQSSNVFYGNNNLFEDYENDNFILRMSTVPGTQLAAPYDRDMYGNIRGVDGIWDVGAFEFNSSGDSNNAPSPPAGLKIVTNDHKI